MKIWKYTFCREFGWGHIFEFLWRWFITVTSLVLRTQSVSAVFFAAVFFATRKCWTALWVKANKSNRKTCLNVKHLCFTFQRIVHIYLNIYPIALRFHRTRESTAAIVASIVETTRRPGSSSSTTLSRPWSNFLHQTRIAGFVKCLSPYWTHRRLNGICASLFAQSKRITERCSLWNDFSGNAAISNVYKWRHSDVIVVKLIARTQN